MKPILVPNWKRAWRWVSVQANVIAQCVLAGWIFLRDQPLPQWVMGCIWAVLLVGLVGRLLKQKSGPGEPDANAEPETTP